MDAVDRSYVERFGLGSCFSGGTNARKFNTDAQLNDTYNPKSSAFSNWYVEVVRASGNEVTLRIRCKGGASQCSTIQLENLSSKSEAVKSHVAAFRPQNFYIVLKNSDVNCLNENNSVVTVNGTRVTHEVNVFSGSSTSVKQQEKFAILKMIGTGPDQKFSVNDEITIRLHSNACFHVKNGLDHIMYSFMSPNGGYDHGWCPIQSVQVGTVSSSSPPPPPPSSLSVAAVDEDGAPVSQQAGGAFIEHSEWKAKSVRQFIMSNKFGFLKVTPTDDCGKLQATYHPNNTDELIRTNIQHGTVWTAEWTSDHSPMSHNNASPPFYLKLGQQYIRMGAPPGQCGYGFLTTVATKSEATSFMNWAGDMLCKTGEQLTEVKVSRVGNGPVYLLGTPSGMTFYNDDKHFGFWHPPTTSLQ